MYESYYIVVSSFYVYIYRNCEIITEPIKNAKMVDASRM
jgi:hypothetical protein